ncbi:MAG: hypothetical protein KF690_08310 [Bacteroidetes bacterium]|nr:hypothetical protein [Bacteroidota bacterium]
MENREHLLLVEGNSEKHVLYTICEKYEIPEVFDVEVAGNNEKARSKFIAEIAGSKYKKVGVVLDNELDQHVWDSFSTGLTRYAEFYEEPFPSSPLGEALIIRSNRKNLTYDDFGIWMMPDNHSKGTLENFLIQMKTGHDLLLDFSEKTLVALEEQKPRIHLYKPVHRNKALVHTYLAWQENPGSPYGLAFKQGAFDLNHHNVKALADWLHRLFADEPAA